MYINAVANSFMLQLYLIRELTYAYTYIYIYDIVVLRYFLGSDLYSLFFYIKVPFVSFPFILVRGTVTCFRCDKLIH